MQILIKRYERSADLTARSSLSQLIATCNDEIWTTSKTWSPKKFIFKKWSLHWWCRKKVVRYMRKNMGNEMTLMLTTMLQKKVLRNLGIISCFLAQHLPPFENHSFYLENKRGVSFMLMVYFNNGRLIYFWRMIIMIKFAGTNFLKLPQIPPTPFHGNPYSLETFER